MKRVRIAELKDGLSAHLRAVEQGQSIEVTDRSRPIAHIVPIPPGEGSIQITAPQRPFSALRSKRYAPAKWGVSSLELLRAERGRR